MIILKYRPTNAPFKAIVWKGVTFDSWWYNLKPGQYILDMHLDMGWSAIALWVFRYLVETNYSGNLVCWIWLVENLISGKAYKPLDIIKMYNWKTVEVINTDAEWRLVLADVLSYVEKKYSPEEIIDLATLTWAAIIALWHEIAPIMWTNKEWIKKLINLWESIKERVWELPLYEKYKKLLESKVADIANLNKDRQAWSIIGWLFLSNFISKAKWIHIDIAWVDIMPKHKIYGAGGSGIGFRLLTKYFESSL
jgi:leucyl aminopeptidase